MYKKINYSKPIPFFSIGILFSIVGLICCDFYIVKYKFFVHLYYSILSILGISILFLVIKKNLRQIKYSRSFSIVIFIFTSYILCHNILFNPPSYKYSIYAFSFGISLLILHIGVNNKILRSKYIECVIRGYAITECCICLMQYYSIINSNNNLFKVTGSFDNPNITAIVLVLILPLFYNKRISNPINLFIILLIGVIFFLKCRTAFIGLSIILSYIIYMITRNIFSKKIMCIFSVIPIAFIIVFGQFIYNSKKASADIRIYMYETALEVIKDNYLVGYGLDRDVEIYNKYLVTKNRINGLNNINENSDYTSSILNDYINYLLKGGIIYLIIILIVILYPFFYHKKISIYHITILSFISMGLTYDLFTYPQILLLISYYIANSIKYYKCTIIKINPFNIGCYLLVWFPIIYYNVKIIESNLYIKMAQKYLNENNLQKSNHFLNKKLIFDDKVAFYKVVSLYHFKNDNYLKSINSLKSILNLQPSAYLMIDLGYLCNKINDTTNSIKYFKYASLIKPALFQPEFELLQIYKNKNDTINARKHARMILNKKIKVQSPQIEYFRNEAQNFIDNSY